MEKDIIRELIKQALAARKNSYAPYSRFRVGAALLDDRGRVFTGVNVENASYPAGLCAERGAVAKAISEGAAGFRAIAIVGGPDHEGDALSSYCPPCGICRQVLSEHCGKEMQVILARTPDDYSIYQLCELLPLSFSL